MSCAYIDTHALVAKQAGLVVNIEVHGPDANAERIASLGSFFINSQRCLFDDNYSLLDLILLEKCWMSNISVHSLGNVSLFLIDCVSSFIEISCPF